MNDALKDGSSKSTNDAITDQQESSVKLMSYRDMVAWRSVNEEEGMIEANVAFLNQISQGEEGELIVEKESIRGYECPTFILPEIEEKRIHRPWKKGYSQVARQEN